ncbi:MAG: PTS sugar transporter subunit IIA [Candidatus Hydrogenedentes bacterium]|nr:PTS sugar transporter subunit IIA [Candidatus Hydrogenedentota bacterium]
MLSDILRPELVKVELEAESRREAIGELVDHLVQHHEISYALRDHALEAVLEREERFVTGMEHGIAVPHGITDRVEDLICALGVSRAGVPYGTRDGKMAHLVVLLLVPKRNYAGEIRLLADIEQLLESSELREAILNAGDAVQIYEEILAAEKGMAA